LKEPARSRREDLTSARSYDTAAAAYDRVAVPRIFAAPAEDLVAMLELPAGGTALDVGAGTGAVSVPAAEAVGPSGILVTLDPSLEMLRQARRKGLTGTVAAKVPGAPFVSNVFDGVMASFVLSHVKDADGALADMVRVLRPGGRLGVTAWSDKESVVKATWQEIAVGFVGAEFLDEAVSMTVPAEDRFVDAGNLKSALDTAGLVDVFIATRAYDVTISAADFLEMREVGVTGRFMRRKLDDSGWNAFRAHAAEVFRKEFADPLHYQGEAHLALGTKAQTRFAQSDKE
jgi:ubiquinone/menaquinone biosynthesis C-methylase UbiE